MIRIPTYAPPRSRVLPAEGLLPRAEAVASATRERAGLLLGLVLVLAAALFSLRLGHSSLFIDEVFSWNASRGDLSRLADSLRYSEVTPPLYYLLLYGWLHIAGSDSEIVMRVPSVLAGVGVVASIYWLGLLVAGRRGGLIAAGLAAISPLLMVYAQQARAYVWVMLALTLAVAAAIRGSRDRSSRYLLLAAVAAAVGILLHYTAIFVLAPLAIWLWRQPGVHLRWRIGFVLAVALPFVALAPLLTEQLSRGHHDIAESYAALSPLNALRIAGTPFDGRMLEGIVLARELGALVVIEALALLALADRFRRLPARWLIVACGAIPLVAVALAGAIGQPTALTRYTAVAAPFILVAIAAVAAHANRVFAAVLVTCALIASGAGVVSSHKRDGLYPDTRAAVSIAAEHWQHGDRLVGIGLLGFDGALSYYGDKLLPRGQNAIPALRTLDGAAEAPPIVDAVLEGRRLWFISDPPVDSANLSKSLEELGYRATATQEFPGSGRIELIRAEPLR